MEREFPGYRVQCRWQSEFDPGVWAGLLDWTRPFLDQEPSDDASMGVSSIVFGTILGHEADDRVAQLHVHRDEETVVFRLDVDPRPESEPPEKIVKLNEITGGRAGFQQFLRSSVGRAAPIADYRIHVTAGRDQYDCQLIPRGLSDREDRVLGDLAGSAQREQVGFRFESGSLGLQEIVVVYFHELDEFSLRIEGRNPLKLGGDRWLPLADDLMALVFDRVFEEVHR